MVLVRVISAILCVFIVIQLAKEPENIDGLAEFTTENMNDLFNWGNDRFVYGRLGDGSGNMTRRGKSSMEIFMDAIMDEDEEAKTVEEAV